MSPPPIAAREPGVFHFINLLRGSAAMLVFYYHLHIHVFLGFPVKPIVPDSWTGWLIHHHFNIGRYAVSLFFLVSGFLIPSTLRKPGATWRDFAIHRFLRLYPAYWLSIAVMVVMLRVDKPAKVIHWRHVLVNLTMFQKFVGVPDTVGVFWTLQIELVFYILCAVLFTFGFLDRSRTILVLSLLATIATAALRGWSGRALPVALPLALMLMFLGDLLRGRLRGEVRRGELRAWVAVVAVAFVPIGLLAYGDKGPGAVLSNLAALGTFLLAFHFRGALGVPGRLRGFGTSLGDVSYSVYLLHGPIGLMLGEWTLRRTGSIPLTLLVALGSTLPVAWLVYVAVETPMIRFGKNLTRRRPAPAPATQMHAVLSTTDKPAS